MLANKPTGSLLEPLRPLATNLCPFNSLCYPTRLPGPSPLVSDTSTLHEPTSLLLSATTTYLPASDLTSPRAFYPPWPPPLPRSHPTGPQALACPPWPPPPPLSLPSGPQDLADCPWPPLPPSSHPTGPQALARPRGLQALADRPWPPPPPSSHPTGPQALARPRRLAPSPAAPRPLPAPFGRPRRLAPSPAAPRPLPAPATSLPPHRPPGPRLPPLAAPAASLPPQRPPGPCRPPLASPAASLPPQQLPGPPRPPLAVIHCSSLITVMSLKRTHVDSESIQDGRHIRTHYNLRPLKLPSCSPGILVAASKDGHQGTSMIGTAHTWHTFQKIPDRLQISGRVEGGGGLRVEEEADLNREAPSSPLTKYSYSDEPSKPAHSKKRTKKLPQPPPPPPPLPSASLILSPILKYPLSFHRLPDRPVLFVMSIGDALSTTILKQSQFPQNDDGPSNTNQPEESAQKPVKQLTRKQEKAKLYSAQLRQKNCQASNIKYSGETRIRAHVSNSNPNARIRLMCDSFICWADPSHQKLIAVIKFHPFSAMDPALKAQYEFLSQHLIAQT
ncbi:hypothetical protein PCANC_05898 [Puccinia coronata f. sp. avenae]|uniref:Uncharacterized protein n=1 Tax=Puccinia coronata f. sp. avenae TaxID=200324 RepID=A0A2N5VY52_9BASI|nr:hypothetical protein PCANC_05898 [Puccinia coronata f. sp. avenae]